MGNQVNKDKDTIHPSTKYVCNESQPQMKGVYGQKIQKLYEFWDAPEIVNIVNRNPKDETPSILSMRDKALITSFFMEFGKLWLETKQWNEEIRSYLHQQLCENILLFYTDYKDFLIPVSDKIRNKKGKTITKTYIDDKGEYEISLSKQCKNRFRRVMIKNNYQYEINSFDIIIIEILYQIKYKIWPGFTKAFNQNIRIIKTISTDQSYDLRDKIVIKNATTNGPKFTDIG